MENDHLVYVLPAGEFQSEVHSAGPVKDMVYDSVNCVDQVNEYKRKYRKKMMRRFLFDEGGKADMCKAMKEHDTKIRVEAGIAFARTFLGNNDEEIVKAVSHQLEVTPEYVINNMKNGASTGSAVRTQE